MGVRTRRTWLVAIALVAIGVGLAVFVRKGTRSETELRVYTRAPERMLLIDAPGPVRKELRRRSSSPRWEIYDPEDEKPFTYPPFFAIPFLPLAGVPWEVPRPAWFFVVWYLVNVAALISIIRIVLRRFTASTGWNRAPPVAAFWLLTAVLAARHVTAVFENQSHDLIVFWLAAMGVDALCRGRQARAGAWVGLAAACKATPLLFGWPWFWQRRVLAMSALVAACALATVVPDVLFPRPDGKLWVIAWYETFLVGVKPGATASAEGAWNAHSFLNQSLSGTLHRLLTPGAEPGPFTIDVAVADVGTGARSVITLLSSLAVLAAIAWPARPSLSRGLLPERQAWRRFGEAGAVLCGMVLLSPMSSKSHFCVLLFPMAFCVGEFLRRRTVAMGVMLGAMFVAGTCTMKGMLGRDVGNWFLAHGTVTWTAALALVATASRLSSSDRNGDGS